VSFSSYWKEIAIVLAGLFAIGGVLSDVRDKRTKRITSWGKLFFGLTVLSVLGGVYAQWLDTEEDQNRNRDAQAKMLRLLEATSRLLQPLDDVYVSMEFMVACDDPDATRFCDFAKANAKNATEDQSGSVTVPFVDWSLWPRAVIPLLNIRIPGEGLSGAPVILFFKDKSDASRFVGDKCAIQANCEYSWDMLMKVALTSDFLSGAVNQWGQQSPPLTITYRPKSAELTISVVEKIFEQDRRTDKITSFADLPEAGVIIVNSPPYTTPVRVRMFTLRGSEAVATLLNEARQGEYVFQFRPATEGSMVVTREKNSSICVKSLTRSLPWHITAR